MNNAATQTASDSSDLFRLAALAFAMRLSPAAAFYLPAYIESAARKLPMSQLDFTAKLERVPELQQYVAQVLTKLAAENGVPA